MAVGSQVKDIKGRVGEVIRIDDGPLVFLAVDFYGAVDLVLESSVEEII